MVNKTEKFNTAFEFHKLGKLDEAENLYVEILEEDNQNAEVWNLLGMINLQKFRLNKAEEYIKKALSIMPNDYFYENLAKVYLEMEDSERAIELYSKLLGKNPKSFNYMFNLASAYKISGELEKAIDTYKKATEVYPLNADAYFNMGLIYDNMGNPQESVKCYQQAIELNPEDMETRYFTALSYFKNRDYKHGFPYFESRLCR